MTNFAPLERAAAARFPVAPKFSVLFISGWMGAAVPLILSLYWVAFWLAPESLGAPLRFSTLGCAFLLAVIWSRAPISHAEINLLRVLGAAAVLWFLATLMAGDVSHAFAGWIKLLVLFAVCCFLARGLRHPATAHWFGLALIAGGLLLVIFIVFVSVRYFGFTLPNFTAAREFKGIALVEGLPLNSIAFGAVFSYLMGLCLVPAGRVLLAAGVPIVLIASIFTGSRAPLAILAASVLALGCFNLWRYRPLLVRMALLVFMAGAALGGLAFLLNVSDAQMRAWTEGRSHLWLVGLDKFSERPLFGYGYESWRDDLVSRLPGEEELTVDLAKRMGGGYHNEYISVLAEEGLLGFAAVGLIVWLLLRSSWLLAFRRWASVQPGQWPLFAAIFLLLRANVEVPGLFGYAQDPADYLAYILLAIVVSRFSVEEDYARSLARRAEAAA